MEVSMGVGWDRMYVHTEGASKIVLSFMYILFYFCMIIYRHGIMLFGQATYKPEPEEAGMPYQFVSGESPKAEVTQRDTHLPPNRKKRLETTRDFSVFGQQSTTQRGR
ncbi:hypothetical protein VTH06DRAFT_6847 [Thermothelomyces fergusii]